MPAKYFTLEDANDLIPAIEPLLQQIMERRSKIIQAKDEIIEMLELGYIDVGGSTASELVIDFIAIEKISTRIRAFGCTIKDLNIGLIDFLSMQNDREVYLCWRYGEPSIEYYHELHAGFANRERIQRD